MEKDIEFFGTVYKRYITTVPMFNYEKSWHHLKFFFIISNVLGINVCFKIDSGHMLSNKFKTKLLIFRKKKTKSFIGNL